MSRKGVRTQNCTFLGRSHESNQQSTIRESHFGGKFVKSSKYQTQRINIKKVSSIKEKNEKLKTEVSEVCQENMLEVPEAKVCKRSPSKSQKSNRSNKSKNQRLEKSKLSQKSPKKNSKELTAAFSPKKG